MNYSEAGKLGALKSKETQQKQYQERVDNYNKNPNTCKQCGKPLDYRHRRNKFCNQSCSSTYHNQKRYCHTYNNKPITYKTKIVEQNHVEKEILVRDFGNCANCGKELNSKQKKYCCSKCEHVYKNKIKIERWKNGIDSGIKTNDTVTPAVKRYLRNKYNNQCARCGWHEINNYTGKVPLEVHHINGNWQDNREENLILLCPNCHSLTSTFRNGNKGKGRKNRKTKKRIKMLKKENKINKTTLRKKSVQGYCKRCQKELFTKGADHCQECVKVLQRKVKRPSKDDLKVLIQTKSFLQIGRDFGVSDNAVRKWCKSYGLPYRKMDIFA